MELITADVLVWRADFQRLAKELYPEFTVLHHAAVAFEACGSLDLQLLTGPMDSALTACTTHFSRPSSQQRSRKVCVAARKRVRLDQFEHGQRQTLFLCLQVSSRGLGSSL